MTAAPLPSLEPRRNSRRRPRALARPFLALLVVAFGVAGMLGVWLFVRHDVVHEESARLSATLAETISLNHKLRRTMDAQVNLLLRYVEQSQPALQGQFERLNFELADDQIRYLGLDIDQRERLAVEQMKRLLDEMGGAAVRVFELQRAGERDEAGQALAQVAALRSRIEREFETLNGMQSARLRAALSDAASAGEAAPAIWAGLLILAGMLAGFLWLLGRRVLNPLDELLRVTSRVRRGDFAARATTRRDDEIGQLARAFNFMAESLGDSYAELERKIVERTRDLERVQKQLIQSEKMSAVGQLVSGVAHELNNPLTTIQGFAELTHGRLAESMPGARELRHLEVVVQQVERCKKIVANLLQFARQQDTELRPVHLNRVVDEALRLRSYELRTRNVRLECRQDPDHPVVLADPIKIEQVLLALINNAVDAIRERGGPGTIRVAIRGRHDHALLTVRDDGAGIREPDRIFDPFYTTKPVGMGTGLGLSVSYGIVREHGGEITAANRERGAEFTVKLPLARAAASDTAAEPPGPESPTRLAERALVVDDEPPLVELQVSVLARLGIHAEGVANGEEAVKYLMHNRVGLVVSDVRMPGRVDGLQLYEWVRRNRPELAGRFLLISGDRVDLPEPVPDGPPLPYLRKPFSVVDYRSAVCGVLGR